MAELTNTDPAGATAHRAAVAAAGRPVIVWLFLCAGMVVLMMLVGAITRLTESGLSIAEWNPLIGALPPLGDAEWQRVFDLYRTTSEYRTVNAGMTLEEFRTIFWWEYLHRLLGRLIGAVFALPLLWFLLRRRIGGALALRLVAIFLLGGLQGGIGWWMVKSGLVDRVDVSQYRLAAHLAIAFLILAAILWTALDLLPGSRVATAAPAALRRGAAALLALIFLMIVSGALVAGLDAGFVYNDWPLMGDVFLPPEYGTLAPWWLNPFENVAAVQFNHRMLAYGIALAALVLWLAARRSGLAAAARRPLDLLLAMVLVQVALGVSALLLHVPLALGVAHQGGAIAVFCLALWSVHTLYRQPR
jgi:cytochrome c oxidase assembly protein subunit 15